MPQHCPHEKARLAAAAEQRNRYRARLSATVAQPPAAATPHRPVNRVSGRGRRYQGWIGHAPQDLAVKAGEPGTLQEATQRARDEADNPHRWGHFPGGSKGGVAHITVTGEDDPTDVRRIVSPMGTGHFSG